MARIRDVRMTQMDYGYKNDQVWDNDLQQFCSWMVSFSVKNLHFSISRLTFTFSVLICPKRPRARGAFWTRTAKEVPMLHNNLDVLHVLTDLTKPQICYHAEVWFLSSVLFSWLGAPCCVFTGLEGHRSRELIWGEDANCQVKVLPDPNLFHCHCILSD